MNYIKPALVCLLVCLFLSLVLRLDDDTEDDDDHVTVSRDWFMLIGVEEVFSQLR